MGKVSIVCAAYNSEDYLTDAANSVKKQDYDDWELLIIDDGSHDSTLQVANDLAEHEPRIKVLKNIENKGPAITRNKGIKMASGRYLTFLDADDFWETAFLSSSVNFIEQNNYEFCFASYFRVDENLEPKYEPFIVPDKVSYEDLLKTCSISCLTAFIDLSKVKKIYMPNIKKRQDYCLWLDILKHVNFAYGIKEPLATYRIREGSVSRNKFKAAKYNWKVYRNIESLSLFNSLYYMVFYTINGFKKYFL